ncbi:TIGR04255 family protein [Microbacterium sp.]|uniref:TIGR04255 family protein n=1 Tax=Microbacterium sp. TaxID=51671 RepID=UPI0031FEC674|nr:TIGR04255 family protein [Microbacterium sp.]
MVQQSAATDREEVESYFPPVDRVTYQKNPLERVISQIRYPPILRIDATPTEFQERIRHRFPVYKEAGGDALGIPPEIAGALPPEIATQVAADIRQAIGARPTPNYSFLTEDESWTVGLTRDSISLTTTRYARWEEFRDTFAPVIEALVAIYSPAYYTRIGLRYRDVICRTEIGIAGVPWSELIAQPIAAELSVEQLEPAIDISSHQAHLLMPDGVEVLLHHGLGTKKESRETCFLIDSDLYTADRTEVPDAARVLDRLHSHAGRLFRWTITDRLHDAMDPAPLA